MAYPFIKARQHGLDNNLPINRIVIHGTVSPTVRGGARDIAEYFSKVARPASAQYVVDPYEIIQCVRDATVAYGAPPNLHSLHVELCDLQAGSPGRWGDDLHLLMLKRAAGLVRALADKYNVPLVKLSPRDLTAGRRGICGHVDVTNAWHETDHTDPGPDFPWDSFMALVRGDDVPDLTDLPHDVWAYDQQGKRRQAWSYLINAEAHAKKAADDSAKTLALVQQIAAQVSGLSADGTYSGQANVTVQLSKGSK